MKYEFDHIEQKLTVVVQNNKYVSYVEPKEGTMLYDVMQKPTAFEFNTKEELIAFYGDEHGYKELEIIPDIGNVL